MSLPLPALFLLPLAGILALIGGAHARAAFRSRDLYDLGVVTLAGITLGVMIARVLQLSAPGSAVLAIRLQYAQAFFWAAVALLVQRDAPHRWRWLGLAALATIPLVFVTHAFALPATAVRVGIFGNRYEAVRTGPLGLALIPVGVWGAYRWLRAVHRAKAWARWPRPVWIAIVLATAAAMLNDQLMNRGYLSSLHLLEYGLFGLTLALSHLTHRRILHDVSQLERAARASSRQVDQAAELLTRSEQRYRLLSELAAEGMALHANGQIVDASEALCQLTGRPAAELVGRPVLELFCRNSRADVATCLQGAQPRAIEARLLTASGETLPVEVMGRSTREAAGIAIRDISERREMQARLVASDRMATLGTLAAGVAHEINNPLSYILANVDYALEELESRDGPRELVQSLADASEGCLRVQRIVNDLRALSRRSEQVGPVDVARVMDSAIQMAHNEIRHRARLVRDYREPLSVVADASRLCQVFLNLLLNAAHAMPVGQADQMQLSVVTRRDARGRVVIEVSDTGCGIPREIHQRIFDPFFTTKPAGQGTGLGLAICQSIVASMGGEIELDSEVGHGTTARLLLAPADEQPTPVTTTRPISPRRSGPSARVLVLDDEPAITRAVKRALSEHDVETAVEARAALELCRNQSFDLILCDLMMPELSGIDFLERLQAMAPELARRVVFMTGAAQNLEHLARAVDNPTIRKPFHSEDLRRMARAAAARSSRAPSSMN
ncbi:MAG: ATP-binding protein [Polyangiaceae bacterium]